MELNEYQQAVLEAVGSEGATSDEVRAFVEGKGYEWLQFGGLVILKYLELRADGRYWRTIKGHHAASQLWSRDEETVLETHNDPNKEGLHANEG